MCVVYLTNIHLMTKRVSVNRGVRSLLRKQTNGGVYNKKKGFLMTEIKMENGCRADPLHLSPPSISLQMKTFRRCIVVCQLLSTTLPYPLLCLLEVYFSLFFHLCLFSSYIQWSCVPYMLYTTVFKIKEIMTPMTIFLSDALSTGWHRLCVCLSKLLKITVHMTFFWSVKKCDGERSLSR